MSKEDFRGSAARLRCIADEIENGRWADIHIDEHNDHAEVPRWSWEEPKGWQCVTRDIRIRLGRPAPQKGQASDG